MADIEGAASLAAWVQENVRACEIEAIAGPDERAIPFLVSRNVYGKYEAISLKHLDDERRTLPERRKGTPKVGDLPSFIAHVNRFKDQDSAIFADDNREKPSLTAVLDYHRAANVQVALTLAESGCASVPVIEARVGAEARWGDHRTKYEFPLSDEWSAWQAKDGKPMSQSGFAEFLEDRIADVIDPPDDKRGDELGRLFGGRYANAAALMDLSRGLRVHETNRVKQAVNLSTGEAQVQFEAEHHDEGGKPLKVPSLFLVAIPVFRNGPLYRLAVRLRYRVSASLISLFFNRYRADKVFDHAFSEACSLAQAETALPLFIGAPE